MKIWAKTEEFSEGKYLVVRRDGTTPTWPHFVLGGCDQAAPHGLEAYAAEASISGFDADYVSSVGELARDFRKHRAEHGDGDPDAPPHRRDLPLAIAMMRGQFDLADVQAATAEVRERAERLARAVAEDAGSSDAMQEAAADVISLLGCTLKEVAVERRRREDDVVEALTVRPNGDAS